MKTFDATVTIEVIKGGFVLHYPVKGNDPKLEKFGLEGIQDEDYWYNVREVFTSPRKLQHKIREVLANVSLVKDDGKDAAE